MSLESGRKNLLESLPEHRVTLRDLLIRDSYFYKDLLRFFQSQEEVVLTNKILAQWWEVTDVKYSKYQKILLPAFLEKDLRQIEGHLLGELTEKDIPKTPFDLQKFAEDVRDMILLFRDPFRD